MLIRNYTASDHAACMEAFVSNVPKFFTLEEVDMFEKFLTKVDKGLFSDTDLQYYVVESSSQIVGCGGIGKGLFTDEQTLIWGLVHANFHQQGFGKALLIHRLEYFDKTRPGELLRMDTSQHTFSFYEKFGFKTIEIKENSFGEGLHQYYMIRD